MNFFENTVSSANLLERISTIETFYLQKLKENGDAFNLISIMGMEHNERYTHSAIIAELLNPRGSHGFDDAFLKLFLKEINCTSFLTEDCKVITEEYVGVIDTETFSSRTFIDIVLRNSCNQEILIENKIFANDQPEQLERTSLASKSQDVRILYLTPFGKPYNSTRVLHYESISYNIHISQWLSKCIELSVHKPLVSNSIKIYKNIIDKITNQNIYSEMNQEIKKEILENWNNFNSAFLIQSNFNELLNSVYARFWDSFQKAFGSPLTDKFECVDFNCLYEINESKSYDDTIYLQIKFTDKDGKTIVNDPSINSIVKSLQEEFSGDPKHSNMDWNAWFYADSENRLYENFIFTLKLEEKYQILTTGDFNFQIKEVAERFNQIVNTLKKLCTS